MDKEEAINIASNYINERNKTNSSKEIMWLVSDAIEQPEFWYFNYKFEFIEKQEFPPGLAGAPGFKILKKDRTILDVGWPEYSRIMAAGR